VDIGLTSVVGFTPSKDQLKRQAPIRHRSDCNSERVNILSVVVLVAVGKLFSYPTLKVWNVAYKIHLTPSQKQRPFRSSAFNQPRQDSSTGFVPLQDFVYRTLDIAPVVLHPQSRALQSAETQVETEGNQGIEV
jgi:hypothetical protein